MEVQGSKHFIGAGSLKIPGVNGRAWDIQSHCCRSYYFLDCECREAGWDPICAGRAQKWWKCFALEDHYYLFLSLNISIKKY